MIHDPRWCLDELLIVCLFSELHRTMGGQCTEAEAFTLNSSETSSNDCLIPRLTPLEPICLAQQEVGAPVGAESAWVPALIQMGFRLHLQGCWGKVWMGTGGPPQERNQQTTVPANYSCRCREHGTLSSAENHPHLHQRWKNMPSACRQWLSVPPLTTRLHSFRKCFNHNCFMPIKSNHFVATTANLKRFQFGEKSK